MKDETRGKAMLNPINYKGDVLVQVWMDSRVLATMSNWLDKTGEIPRHMSHVVRRPLELLAMWLVDEGEVEMVDDTELARFLLEGRYNVNLNRGDKGRKNKLHNQLLSDKRRRLTKDMKRESFREYQDAANPMSGKNERHVDGNRIDKLVKVYHKMGNVEVDEERWEEAKKKIEEDKKERRKKDVQAGIAGGYVIADYKPKEEVKEEVPERPDYSKMSDEEMVEYRQKIEKEQLAQINDPKVLEYLKANAIKE